MEGWKRGKVERHKMRIICGILLALCVWGLGGWAEAAAELRGPLPILSVPYHDDGALDVETLVKEARFVADAGVGGFIWCQSNDAIDLLTREEKMRSFAALARAFENADVYVILGCQGRDTDEMVALATEVERLAAAHPATKLAIACRPPHDARSQDDLERYYRRLAGIARRHEGQVPSHGRRNAQHLLHAQTQPRLQTLHLAEVCNRRA